MSVNLLDEKDYGEIADFITVRVISPQSNEYFMVFTDEENMRFREHQLRMKSLKADVNMDEMKEKSVACFVDRLYIANQLAFYYNYSENIEIKRLSKEDIKNGYINKNFKWFLKKLNSIRYNIYTNGGNSFLSKKDEEKLDWLIDQAKDQLLKEVLGER